MYNPAQPADGAVCTSYGPIPPKSNVGWAVAAIVFFWPVAFSAFTHSNNVYQLWCRGDFAGAQYASDRAKRLGQISIFVSLGIGVLYFAFLLFWMMTLVSNLSSF